MLTPEDHIAGLTKLIAGYSGVKRIILFGSRARGYASARSDIDLAVEVGSDAIWRDMQEQIESYPTLLKIDFVRLTNNESDFERAILKTGRVLYEN